MAHFIKLAMIKSGMNFVHEDDDMGGGYRMNLGRETETLEFKKSTGELKEGIISICSILNKHQKGELYFGIKPDGTPIG